MSLCGNYGNFVYAIYLDIFGSGKCDTQIFCISYVEFFIFLAPNSENLVALHCLFVCWNWLTYLKKHLNSMQILLPTNLVCQGPSVIILKASYNTMAEYFC